MNRIKILHEELETAIEAGRWEIASYLKRRVVEELVHAMEEAKARKLYMSQEGGYFVTLAQVSEEIEDGDELFAARTVKRWRSGRKRIMSDYPHPKLPGLADGKSRGKPPERYELRQLLGWLEEKLELFSGEKAELSTRIRAKLIADKAYVEMYL